MIMDALFASLYIIVAFLGGYTLGFAIGFKKMAITVFKKFLSEGEK